jgi:protein-S-isoprenylcysteine O-methyltransferase Ste14
MMSLIDHKRTPADELVTAGLDRYSRNPQWLGLVGVFVGAALAVGGWLPLFLAFLLIAPSAAGRICVPTASVAVAQKGEG